MNHLLNNNLISESQYGFLHGKSCTLQLLEMMNDWTTRTDPRISIDVLYTYLRKAFDTVPHRRLLHKITTEGFLRKKHSCGFIFSKQCYTQIFLNTYLLHKMKSSKHEHLFCLYSYMSSIHTLSFHLHRLIYA